MLKNETIICISSIDWDFVWQGHQEIMSAFAKNGNRVLFVENTGVRTPTAKDIVRLGKRLVNWMKSVRGFKRESENLFIYSPVILPFPYSKIARWINRFLLIRPLKRWLKMMGFRDPIIWTFLPTGIALDIINNIDGKLLVYYCIADFDKLTDSPKRIRATEDELIKRCDVIFAQGSMLEERCKKLNPNVHIFPFGVNVELFENFKYDAERVPEDIRGLKRPIIGYVGGIHRHLDFGLIKFMAKVHPEWSIVLVGPIQTNVAEINGLENVHFTGKKNFSDLPNYIHEFDVCIIPYVLNRYTETVFPTKLNEYHAMGKPVVSTNLPEVAAFNVLNDNLVTISGVRGDFTKGVEEVLKVKANRADSRRLLSAKKNNWSSRIEAMSAILAAAIEEKKRESIDWVDGFRKFYRSSRGKTATVIAGLVLAYLLVFYTPLAWLMAEPLRISRAPHKADCIVVLAGGVGESGVPGQGYEERVQYAVELYNKGYAGHLIFSSGSAYLYREPLLMKALAASMSVPENAIIMEDRARNTMENVKFSKEILDSYNWHDILLVSSPYNMRRVALVFHKIAKDINVTYTPIQNSLFYSHKSYDSKGRRIWKRVTVRQLEGIIHEYMAIVYYLVKGYV